MTSLKATPLIHGCRGFLVSSTTEAVNQVSALSADHKPTIEEDGSVSTQQ